MQKVLTQDEHKALLKTLQARFEKNMNRHQDMLWKDVEKKLLDAAEEKLWSLQQMELTGGEPDVISFDKKSKEYVFFDCSPESPKERRSLCYDDVALNARKENKPADSAVNMAHSIGICLLTEQQYRALQQLGVFDVKTSSWVETPPAIRKLGGAIFCDRRYNTVFTYHNGAESYYAARGFRGCLSV